MGAAFLGNTIAANNGFYASLKVHDEETSRLGNPRYTFNYRMRNQQTTDATVDFTTLWPSSAFCGDTGNGYSYFGNNNNGGWNVAFEESDYGNGGAYEPLHVTGQTLNSLGAPLPGVTVLLFLTATNAFVGQVTSDANGNYAAPTPWTGQNHFVVAYLAGSPDVAGTTIDELTPS